MITRLVSLGSVIVDFVLEVPHLPERGGDVLATGRGMAVGGALNVMSAAARLGLPALYAGPHGTGPFGDLVRAALAREGIGLVQAPNPDLDTGWTAAMIEPDGERTFVTVTGADAVVDAGGLNEIAYLQGDAVYVSGYDLAYAGAGVAIADHVRTLPPDLFVVFDPGPLVADIAAAMLRALLGRADLLSLNERELRALGGIEAVESGAVVVRQGAEGATLYQAGLRPVQVSAVAVIAVADTSGAGDVHVGATLAGLGRGMALPEAVLLANRAAAYSVSTKGPASGPTSDQLEKFGAGRW